MQNMNKTRQAVETVNFRLLFKVVIRQNEINTIIFTIKQALIQISFLPVGSVLV